MHSTILNFAVAPRTQGLATINKAQQLIHFVGYSDIVDYFNNTVPSTLITYSYTQQRFLDSIAIERPTGEYVRELQPPPLGVASLAMERGDDAHRGFHRRRIGCRS
jgi:hypothetical protein